MWVWKIYQPEAGYGLHWRYEIKAAAKWYPEHSRELWMFETLGM